MYVHILALALLHGCISIEVFEIVFQKHLLVFILVYIITIV